MHDAGKGLCLSLCVDGIFVAYVTSTGEVRVTDCERSYVRPLDDLHHPSIIIGLAVRM